MWGFVGVLAFPVFLLIGYGALYGIVHKIWPTQYKEKLSPYILPYHCLLTTLPLSIALTRGWSVDPLVSIGVQWPTFSRLSPTWSTLVSLTAGALLALFLFSNERRFEKYFDSRKIQVGSVGPKGILEPNEHLHALYSSDFTFAMMLFLAFAEEAIWRSYLIGTLVHRFLLAKLLSVIISSIIFGVNHLYVGVRQSVFKTISGLAWGLLYMTTSSILGAFFSHMVFNWLAWQQFKALRMSPTTCTERSRPVVHERKNI